MKDAFGSDPDQRLHEDLNWLEQLARKIPGFKGYLEKRDRREADQLLRETLAARFEEVRVQFGRVQEELSRDIIKAIDFAEPMGRIDNRLMGLIGKIKDAPQGYAGFFDAVKVDAERLESIYMFDRTMIGHGEQIALDVEALGTAVDENGDLRLSIRQLDNSVQAAVETFAGRHEVVTGLE